jgi:hypothetical protein
VTDVHDLNNHDPFVDSGICKIQLCLTIKKFDLQERSPGLSPTSPKDNEICQNGMRHK